MPSDANPFSGRDRVLMYTRGMDISPEKSVELALRSMRQAGENASAGEVMEHLFRILQEARPLPGLRDSDGKPLASAPPMNRKAMIAGDMGPFSLTGAFLRRFRSAAGKRSGNG